MIDCFHNDAHSGTVIIGVPKKKSEEADDGAAHEDTNETVFKIFCEKGFRFMDEENKEDTDEGTDDSKKNCG